MRTQIIQATLGTLLFLAAACGGEITQTEDGVTSSSVVSTGNSYCYDIQSGTASTGRKCFSTKSAFCTSLCSESISGAATQCKAQCPGYTPAPTTDGGATDGGTSGGGGSTGTNNSYCFDLQCGSTSTGRQCFSTKTAFCTALKSQTCSAASLYYSLFCR